MLGIARRGRDGGRSDGRYPWWIVIPYTAFVIVLVPIYWRDHGPQNFLWYSDIALVLLLLSLWTGWRLPYSMMAVGVLPMEALWFFDFLALGNLTGTAAYMWGDEMPLYLRALSSFHFFVSPILLWMLYRQGYDRRALIAQTALIWMVLPATYLLSEPQDNINYVYGLDGPQQLVDPLVYLGLYMLLVALLVHLPMHALMTWLFGDDAGSRGQRSGQRS